MVPFLLFWVFDPLPISALVGVAPEKDALTQGVFFSGNTLSILLIWSKKM